jgi:hypothetical protein
MRGRTDRRGRAFGSVMWVRVLPSVMMLVFGSAACARSGRETPTEAAAAVVPDDDASVVADAPVPQVPPSTPVAAEPGPSVREVKLANRYVRVELPPEASMRHDPVNEIVTFELGWKQTVQLAWKSGAAPKAIRTQSDDRVLDEGQTETGLRYSIQTFEVRMGESNAGRHVHWNEWVARVYAILPVDKHHHVQCTGFLEHQVDDVHDEGLQSVLRVCLSMALVSPDVGENPLEPTGADPAKGTTSP